MSVCLSEIILCRLVRLYSLRPVSVYCPSFKSCLLTLHFTGPRDESESSQTSLLDYTSRSAADVTKKKGFFETCLMSQTLFCAFFIFLMTRQDRVTGQPADWRTNFLFLEEGTEAIKLLNLTDLICFCAYDCVFFFCLSLCLLIRRSELSDRVGNSRPDHFAWYFSRTLEPLCIHFIWSYKTSIEGQLWTYIILGRDIFKDWIFLEKPVWPMSHETSLTGFFTRAHLNPLVRLSAKVSVHRFDTLTFCFSRPMDLPRWSLTFKKKKRSACLQ